MHLYRHYYTTPKHQIPFDLNANANGPHKVELTEGILDLLRRKTRKVYAYWMLPPIENRKRHERFTDRELKNISAVRNNNVATGNLVEHLTLGSC